MKNISLIRTSLFVVVAGFSSSLVFAEDNNATTTNKLKKEAISAAVNVVPVAFETYDTDKNGSLSKEEINAGNDKLLKSVFEKVDKNSDGELSEEEFNIAIAQLK